MSKKLLPNWETPSTETLPPPREMTTDEIIAELREKFPMRQEPPEWYMTGSQFMVLASDVVLSLPWMSHWEDTPGHPEDIAVSVSMAIETMTATITALSGRGILKYRGQE